MIQTGMAAMAPKAAPLVRTHDYRLSRWARRFRRRLRVQYRKVNHVGLVLLQLIGLVPFLGGFVVFLAGWIGSGALIYLGFRGWSDRRPADVAPVGPAAMPAA